MGLLDGALRNTIGRAIGPILLAGTLHKANLRQTEFGETWEEPFTDYPIRVAREELSERVRAELGIPETDARLIIMQYGVPVSITADDEITLMGARWRVAIADQDPAGATWTVRVGPV